MTRAEGLLISLRESVAAALSGEECVAISYSGGLDSSVMARLASEVTVARAYSCVTEGSFDAKNIEKCAQEEQLELSIIKVHPEDLRAFVKRAASVLRSSDPVPIAYTIPVICVVDHSRERVVVLGSGADELFGGYAKYGSMSDPEGAMASDLMKMRRELALVETYARSKGKRLVCPFITDSVTALAAAMPLDRKFSKDERKIVLREAAALLNLKSSSRPKKAAQYSSGILREMERRAKGERLEIREWTSKVVGEPK